MINMIAAIGKNNELGKNGNLIWPLKKDLKFFREMTLNHDIVMGRKTFESLPKLLDQRRHLVLSRHDIKVDGVKTYHDIKGILLESKDKDIFVIGGQTVYEEFMDYAENLYITHILAEDKDADTFFPAIDPQEFKRIYLDEDIENDILFKHVLYKRRH